MQHFENRLIDDELINVLKLGTYFLRTTQYTHCHYTRPACVRTDLAWFTHGNTLKVQFQIFKLSVFVEATKSSG